MAAPKKDSALLAVLRLMGSRRWWPGTLAALVVSAVCIRLSVWQVGRLQQASAFDVHLAAVQAMPALNLPAAGDLTAMEYRRATASGVYDFQEQIAMRDQYYGVQPGYHLLTPLRLSNGQAVLVDRGWIPSSGNASPAAWRQYDVPGQISVDGIIRLGQAQAAPGATADPTLTPGQTRLDFWVYVNLARLGRQIPYPLLPIYIQISPIPNHTDPPIPVLEPLDFSDWSVNLNYAVQWSLFAFLAPAAYGYYLWRRELRVKP